MNRNLSTKSIVKAIAHSLITNQVVSAGGERSVCFLLQYVTSFKMDPQNFHLLIVARNILTRYHAKIIKQNGTFENTSKQNIVNSVLFHTMNSAAGSVQAGQLQQYEFSPYLGWVSFIPQADRTQSSLVAVPRPAKLGTSDLSGPV